jgi:hypothetical protein
MVSFPAWITPYESSDPDTRSVDRSDLSEAVEIVHGVPCHGQEVGVRTHLDPSLAIGNPTCPRGEAGRRSKCLQRGRTVRGHLGDGVRQHIVRLQRHDARVRTNNDLGFELVQVPVDVLYVI